MKLTRIHSKQWQAGYAEGKRQGRAAERERLRQIAKAGGMLMVSRDLKQALRPRGYKTSRR